MSGVSIVPKEPLSLILKAKKKKEIYFFGAGAPSVEEKWRDLSKATRG
jgi:hypothetical protein